MTLRYQSIYPSAPLLRSVDIVRPRAADLLSLEFIEAEPADMPTEVFAQHHLLLNLQPLAYRAENWRDGDHRDFIHQLDDICITPAGIRSGWRWHSRTKVIVVTIEPARLDHFVRCEMGLVLAPRQLRDVPQVRDPDLVAAGAQLLDALRDRGPGFEVIYEALARIFLVKLVQRYGEFLGDGASAPGGLDSGRCGRVLHFVSENFSRPITIEQLADVAAMRPARFARAFRQAVGETPYRYVLCYRIEQAKRLLTETERDLGDIARDCGFVDQPHLTRVFKKVMGNTPRQWRNAQMRDRSSESAQSSKLK